MHVILRTGPRPNCLTFWFFMGKTVSASPTPKGSAHPLIPLEVLIRSRIQVEGLRLMDLSRDETHIIYSIPFAENALAKRKIFEDF